MIITNIVNRPTIQLSCNIAQKLILHCIKNRTLAKQPHKLNTLDFTETPPTICSTRLDFGVDPVEESTWRGGVDGFSYLQENELTLLNPGLVNEGKPSFGDSSLLSLGSKGEGLLRWVFRGVGGEYRSLSMTSLCMRRGKYLQREGESTGFGEDKVMADRV